MTEGHRAGSGPSTTGTRSSRAASPLWPSSRRASRSSPGPARRRGGGCFGGRGVGASQGFGNPGRGAYKVHPAIGEDLWVRSQGEQSWKALVNQTLRWNNGGLFSAGLSTRLNFGFLMAAISMGIIAIPLLPFIPSLWPLSAAVLFSMSMNTIATLKLFGAALPGPGVLAIIQVVFTPLYFTFLTVLGFCGVKADWKGVKMSGAPDNQIPD